MNKKTEENVHVSILYRTEPFSSKQKKKKMKKNMRYSNFNWAL